MTKDMTTGRPAKMIYHFTLPIFIGNVFQQFYSMADTIIVGKFVGNSALTAVGACGTLMFLILGFLIGMTTGFTVVTAQHYGAGNQTAMRGSVTSAMLLSAVLNIILDPLFVNVFRLGAMGAAYATVISQGISGLLCMVYIAKKVPELHFRREDWKIDWNLTKWQMKIGFPMAFQ